MGVRVLVTGVAGLIGSWLVDALCADPEVEQVIGIDDLSGGVMANVNVGNSRKFRFEQFDLMRQPMVMEIFGQTRPHIVVHAAACAREGASAYQPVKITQTNLMISTIVMEAGIHYGMHKYVHFSSMAVIGDQKPPFHEKMKMAPVDPYGINKAATEQMVAALAQVHGFKYAIIRPHNVMGPRQSLSDIYRNVCGIFMNRIMRREPLYIFGEGSKRAFSYIEDSLPAFTRAILTDNADGKTVFIGGKEEIFIDDLAQEVINLFYDFPKPEIIRVPLRPLEVKEAYCSIDLSVQLLGYEEKIGWRQGLKNMAEWAKNQGPQKWRTDKLPLANKDMPRPWRELPFA